MINKENVISLAEKLVGIDEHSQQHIDIVDFYNKQKNLPRNVLATYDMEWCAIFLSYLFLAFDENTKYTEMSAQEFCNKIEERVNIDNVEIGDIIGFDWDGNGWVDHVGIVCYVAEHSIAVIEGNKTDECQKIVYPKTYSKIEKICRPIYQTEKTYTQTEVDTMLINLEKSLTTKYKQEMLDFINTVF